MKRFYKTVTVGDDLSVLLDGRPLKSPAKADLKLPSRSLAEAIAEEWRGQGETVDAHAMILTRLANTAIDRVASQRDAIVEELVGYGGADLLSYRADDISLALRQAAGWDPVVDWAREALGAPLAVTTGVTHVPQSAKTLAAFGRAVGGLDDWSLSALQILTTVTGSLTLALAVAAGRITAGEAFALSRLDEDYQAEKWGEDREARKRAEGLAREAEMAGKFIALARA
jgi:chaperone required for assembly of F1-ATPase